MRLLLIDNITNVILRYVDGKLDARFNITNRQDFDKSFTQARAEQLRRGAPIGAKARNAVAVR